MRLTVRAVFGTISCRILQIIILMHQRPAFADHSAQHVFLSVNNPRPCLGAIVEFVCYYPELLARKYRITSPNWSKDGKLFFIDGNVTVQHTVNTTASRLTLTIFRSWFDGDPAFFDCYFPLVLGGEHRSNSILVHPQDRALPAVVRRLLIISTTAILMWDHTNKGPCFNHLTFSYNITWYPVVGGVPQRGEGQRVTTGINETQLLIPDLMYSTRYKVEILGISSTPPQLGSEPTTANFTTNAGTAICSNNTFHASIDFQPTIYVVVGIVLCMVVSLLVIVTLVLAVTVCNLKRKVLRAKKHLKDKLGGEDLEMEVNPSYISVVLSSHQPQEH